MKITWHGDSTIELENQKMLTVLNPQSDKQLENAQLVLYSKTDEKNRGTDEGLMIDWPGEYDTAGFTFKGVEIHGKNGSTIAYSFQSEAGNVTWMGDVSEMPSESTLEALGEVHVLIVPVGGGDVLDAKTAFKLVESLEPMVVIPICYGDKREGLQSFLKEMDVKLPDAQKRYECKKSVLGSEQMDLVILEEV